MKHTFIKMVMIAVAVVASAFADETFNGVGVAITPAEKGAEVVSVIPGTPAADSKLQKGDVIISVNGNNTYCKKMEDVQTMLRGEKNKPVEIVFISNGDTLGTTIRRTELTVKNLDGEEVASKLNKKNVRGDELESYADNILIDKKLVAVVKQGEVIDDKANVETKNIDCIYVNKDVIDAPSPVTQKKNGEKIKVKGVNRNSISFELQSAGTAVVTVTNSGGVVVSSVLVSHAMVGYNRVSWNSSNVPDGRYVISVEHNGFKNGKSVFLK